MGTNSFFMMEGVGGRYGGGECCEYELPTCSQGCWYIAVLQYFDGEVRIPPGVCENTWGVVKLSGRRFQVFCDSRAIDIAHCNAEEDLTKGRKTHPFNT
jgi:hypothetical protein